MQEYILWLDDERPPKLPFATILPVHWAKSTEEAIRAIGTLGVPGLISFDHDLGGEDSAMNFLHWLAQNHLNSPPDYLIHSENVCGRENIQSFMQSWHKTIKKE